MADYKVVDAEKLDAELKSLADKIREKGGTTENLDFYKGDFTNAVGAIESGGGGEDVKGIILSDFTTDTLKPQIADMRSLVISDEAIEKTDTSLFSVMFQNTNYNTGGYYVSLREVYLPDKLPAFSNNMFTNCAKLTKLHGDLSSIKKVGNSTFLNGRSLVEFPYMPILETIDGLAFQGCIAFTEVTLPSTIKSIASNAFNGCTNLLNIYVPWAEGAIANAPWGATNATIHYNSEV